MAGKQNLKTRVPISVYHNQLPLNKDTGQIQDPLAINSKKLAVSCDPLIPQPFNHPEILNS
jgi:hypothetical protein